MRKRKNLPEKYREREVGFAIDDNELELVKRFYLGEIGKDRVPKHLREQLIRWEDAHRWTHEHREKKKVVNLLVNTHKISETQAYRDIKNMQGVFGMTQDWNLNYIRNLLFEMNMKFLNKAEFAGDFKAMGVFMKELRELWEKTMINDAVPKGDLSFTQILIMADPKAAGIFEGKDVDNIISFYDKEGRLPSET